MIFKWDVVTFLFMFVQFLTSKDIEADIKEIRANAKPPVVVNGNPVYEGKFPFSVIFYETKPRVIRTVSYMSPICSGAVISSRWILTTAVPLGYYEINKYFVLAGVQRISPNPDFVTNFTNNIYRIEMMVVHPKWHEYNINNLGMVKITEPLKFGRELGTIRMPKKYDVKFPSLDNDTTCYLNIWGTIQREHLLGHYQLYFLSKQSISLYIQKDPLKFCPEVVYSDKTLCLKQYDLAKPRDICTVNLGGIVHCDCEAVGVFSGVNGKLNCVGLPPQDYTAVNITQYLKWISTVSEATEPEEQSMQMRTISSALHISLSFNLIIIEIVITLY